MWHVKRDSSPGELAMDVLLDATVMKAFITVPAQNYSNHGTSEQADGGITLYAAFPHMIDQLSH